MMATPVKAFVMELIVKTLLALPQCNLEYSLIHNMLFV